MRKWTWERVCGLACGLACGFGGLAGPVAAAEPAPAAAAVPLLPEAEMFKAAPAVWRDYLLAAVRAERIEDPGQRCLAYPDLPGNQWPAGHVRAHCLDHVVRATDIADFRPQLAAGRVEALEAYLRKVLALHANKQDASEELHYFFNQFAVEGADAFTADWLRLQPESPYALTARAEYLSGAARRARGGRFVAETPPQDLRRMTTLYDQALPLYRKAVALAPGFIVPWIGMLGMAYRDSRPALEQEAFVAARAIDPGCMELADTRMTSLQPRWGGSYDAMLSYAASLQGQLAAHPNLAQMLAAPYADRGDRLIADDVLTAETADVLDLAVHMSSAEEPLIDAANVAANAKDGSGDGWKSLAYTLQAVRFGNRTEWAHRWVAWRLLHDAPDVSVRHVGIALQQDPDSALLHYIAGAAFHNTRQPGQAEAHYLKAIEDPEQRHASLRELVSMWMFNAGLSPKDGSTKAAPYLQRLLREYPQDGRAWLYRIQAEGAMKGVVPDQFIKDFEQHADRADPMQAHFLERLDDARQHRVIMPAPPVARP